MLSLFGPSQAGFSSREATPQPGDTSGEQSKSPVVAKTSLVPICSEAASKVAKRSSSTRVARFELAFLTSKVGINQGLIQEAMLMISGGVGNSDHLYSVGPPWSDGDVDKKTKPNHKDF